jgi:hypothetical protein
MKKVVLVVGILLCMSNVFAHEWFELGKTEGDALFIDTENLTQERDGLRLFWMLVDHKQSKKTDEGEVYRSTKMMHVIDCTAQQTAIKMIVHHTMLGAEGRVIRTIRRSDDKLDFRNLPGTELWATLNTMFCKK